MIEIHIDHGTGKTCLSQAAMSCHRCMDPMARSRGQKPEGELQLELLALELAHNKKNAHATITTTATCQSPASVYEVSIA